MTVFDAENHPDPVDIASDLEMRATESAIYEARKKMKRDQEPDSDGIYPHDECLACGGEIGEGRLKYALRNTLCIYCATEAERRAKR